MDKNDKCVKNMKEIMQKCEAGKCEKYGQKKGVLKQGGRGRSREGKPGQLIIFYKQPTISHKRYMFSKRCDTDIHNGSRRKGDIMQLDNL